LFKCRCRECREITGFAILHRRLTHQSAGSNCRKTLLFGLKLSAWLPLFSAERRKPGRHAFAPPAFVPRLARIAGPRGTET
jgi:hypothetical protein